MTAARPPLPPSKDEVEQLWDSADPRSIWSTIRPFVDDEGVIGAVTPTAIDNERLVLQ